MTQEQKVIRAKVGMLELAWQLGNVSQACRVPELVQVRFILPNLAMLLINLESPRWYCGVSAPCASPPDEFRNCVPGQRSAIEDPRPVGGSGADRRCRRDFVINRLPNQTTGRPPRLRAQRYL